MSASEQFERFIEAAPFAVLTRAVLREVMGPEQLDEFFERNSREQYQRTIPFFAIVYAMAELALGTITSKNQAYKKYQQEIVANKAAFYNKLNRTEPGISEALVRFSADKVKPLLKKTQLPILGSFTRLSLLLPGWQSLQEIGASPQGGPVNNCPATARKRRC